MAGTNIALTETGYNKASDKSWLGTRKGLQDMRSITLDISSFAAEHIENGYLPSGIVLAKITATGKYGPYTPGTVVQESASIAVDATGGTFTITFQGETTAAIAFNASAAAVLAALELLPDINPGDFAVTGGPGAAGGATPYVITALAGGQWADQDIPNFTTGVGSLTGGAGTAAVTTTTGGGTGAASNGLEVAAGHLFEEVKVVALTDADCGAALFWNGVVKKSRLPAFSGTGNGKGEVDDACEATLHTIRYED